jgi:acetoacetyl-CoA synthetase
MSTIAEGTLLWEPPSQLRRGSTMQAYIDWLAEHKNLHFGDYAALWQWSVQEIEAFWESLWQFFDLRAAAPYTQVLAERRMPGAHWFTGARLSYAEQVFRNATATHPAIVYESELRPLGQPGCAPWA